MNKVTSYAGKSNSRMALEALGWTTLVFGGLAVIGYISSLEINDTLNISTVTQDVQSLVSNIL